jgi:hypothetical protein
VPAPLPPRGSARSVQRFTEIWDKGKAAGIVSETSVTNLDDKPLWRTTRSIFARGEGGFGGERGPSTSVARPDRAPDVKMPLPILPQQALLYRQCRNRDPLHADPEFRCGGGVSASRKQSLYRGMDDGKHQSASRNRPYHAQSWRPDTVRSRDKTPRPPPAGGLDSSESLPRVVERVIPGAGAPAIGISVCLLLSVAVIAGAAGVCATTDRSAVPRRRDTHPWRAAAGAASEAAGHEVSPITCTAASCFASTSTIKPAIAPAASTTVSKGRDR